MTGNAVGRVEPVVRELEDALRDTRAQLRDQQARLGQALRSAPLIALSQDTALHVTWGFVLGREVSADGKTDDDLFDPPVAAFLGAAKREIVAERTGRRIEVDLTIDGVVRTFDFRIDAIVEDGVVTGVRSIGFDITPSKVAEAALRDADARKDAFLATVSHELRTPLTPLRAALDLLTMEPPDAARQQRASAVMNRQVVHLARLVDDLLDVSRIAENKLGLEDELLEVRDLFQIAVEAVRQRVDQAGHTLTVEPPPPEVKVTGDHTRLIQVLTNLLTNACKYTPPGGHLYLGTVGGDPGTVTIVVRDDGNGIAPELLPRVFELFVQAEGSERRAGSGLGIGLHLVRRLVELHGGQVSAHSAGPGHGTEIRVCLPARDPRRCATPASPPA